MNGVRETAYEEDAITWLEGQREAMTTLLADLVNIDSGSYDKAGVDRVGECIAAFLRQHEIDVRTIPVDGFGDVLHAAVGPKEGRPILMMGHRDTVFAEGEAGRRPFRLEGPQAFGPGVADMKSGLVMISFVLAGLRRYAGLRGPVGVLYTGDEEIGSPSSRPIIEAAAAGARAVFNAEPARISGNVVDERKGALFMRFAITGRAAHSGSAFSEGVSAIEELARKITALHVLTDHDRGITVNVGLVGGGQSVNTVAPAAFGTIDLRYVAPADREWALHAVRAIVEECSVEGATAELSITGEFLPLQSTGESRALFRLYQAAASDVGVTLSAEATGGCADSGFTAALGVPTLCAVGPVGTKGHTPEEYLLVDTMVPRGQALALAILRLDSEELPPPA